MPTFWSETYDFLDGIGDDIKTFVKRSFIGFAGAGTLGLLYAHSTLSESFGASTATVMLCGAPIVTFILSGTAVYLNRDQLRRKIAQLLEIPLDVADDLVDDVVEMSNQVIDNTNEFIGDVRQQFTGRPLRDVTRPENQSLPTAPTGVYASILNSLVESEGHILVVGETRGGKSTMIHDMAVNLSRMNMVEGVLAFDPDAVAGRWPHCLVFGRGDDYDDINEGLTWIVNEMDRRNEAHSKGMSFTKIIVIMDEVKYILQNAALGRQVWEDILRRGAKLGVNMICGTQDANVKTLGIEGSGAIRDNFALKLTMKWDKLSNTRTFTVQSGDRVQEHKTPALKPMQDYQLSAGVYDGSHFIKQLASTRLSMVQGGGVVDQATSSPVQRPLPMTIERPVQPVQQPVPTVVPPTVQFPKTKPVQDINKTNLLENNYDLIVANVKAIVAKNTDQTRIPYGNGYLTVGQAKGIRILSALAGRMKLSKTAIAKIVFGGSGGYQSQAIDRISNLS